MAPPVVRRAEHEVSHAVAGLVLAGHCEEVFKPVPVEVPDASRGHLLLVLLPAGVLDGDVRHICVGDVAPFERALQQVVLPAHRARGGLAVVTVCVELVVAIAVEVTREDREVLERTLDSVHVPDHGERCQRQRVLRLPTHPLLERLAVTVPVHLVTALRHVRADPSVAVSTVVPATGLREFAVPVLVLRVTAVAVLVEAVARGVLGVGVNARVLVVAVLALVVLVAVAIGVCVVVIVAGAVPVLAVVPDLRCSWPGVLLGVVAVFGGGPAVAISVGVFDHRGVVGGARIAVGGGRCGVVGRLPVRAREQGEQSHGLCHVLAPS